MPERLQAIGWFTVIWVVILAGWGGAVRYIQRIKLYADRKFAPWDFAGEIVTSAFVGVITFVLCKAAEIDIYITAALIAIAGHEGGRALVVMRRIIIQRADIGGVDSGDIQRDSSGPTLQSSERKTKPEDGA